MGGVVVERYPVGDVCGWLVGCNSSCVKLFSILLPQCQ